MSKKTGISLIIVSTLLITAITIAVSYAYWTTTKSATKTNKIVSGCFDMTLTNENNAINLQNAYPITDSEAESLTPYTFTITNTCELYASYNVNLEMLAGSDLPSTAIATRVNDNEKKILGTLTAGEKAESTSVESRTLISGELYPNESITYELRVWMDESVTLEDNAEGKILNGKIVLIGTASKTDVPYKEDILNGANPVIADNLIPVTIGNDGTVKKADLYSKWYDYSNKKWANAVILEDTSISYNDGETIPESNIESYFVWIPKYSYQLFNLGNYNGTIEERPTTSNAKEIQIKFGLTNTSDSNSGECTTPMESGATGNCEEGEYMTHPAFITMESNGLWVGKFETTGTTDNISVKPGIESLRNVNVKTMFDTAYNYQRSNFSHMMKNTEWGAVAYLSHSKYGINTEVNINNNSSYITGYSSVVNQSTYPGTSGTTEDKTLPYNTETGYKASTTGNITGIYDMSGGAWEFMASHISGNVGTSNFDTTIATSDYQKYLDVYNTSSSTKTYQYRILGDATGEIGAFYTYADGDGAGRHHNSWYADASDFVDTSYPWFHRGGYPGDGVLAGQFYFDGSATTHSAASFRLVLAP